MEPQGIARPHRTRPAQLVNPAADDASRQRQRLDDELHGERRRVPSAGDQFLEERRARHRIAQVPRLRIELASKSFDRICVDDGARVRVEHLPRSEVLEISLVHRILLREAARRGMANRPRTARSPGPALCGRSAINGGLFSPMSMRCKGGSGRRMTGFPLIPAKAGIQIFEHDDWIPAYAGMSGRCNNLPLLPAKAGTQILKHGDWIPAYAGMSGEMGGPTSATEPLIHAATSGAATDSTTKRYLRPRASVAHQQSRSSS